MTMATQAPGNAEHQFSEPHVEILSLETPEPEAPSPTTAAGSEANRRRPPRAASISIPTALSAASCGPDLQSGLCLRHFREKFVAALPPSPSDSEDLFADLLPEPTDFSFGEDVQNFLARLATQVTKGGISPRRATVLGYLTNQLLNSHRAIDLDEELETESQQIIFDLPRPKRD